MLNELLEEYKNQFKKLCLELIKIESQIKALDVDDEDYEIKLNKLKCRRNNIDYFKSNLNYTIKWITFGHEPNVYGGIDNIKAYK